MIKHENKLTGGITLIVLGLAFLVGQFVANAWPLILIGVGSVFLFAAMQHRIGGLAIDRV